MRHASIAASKYGRPCRMAEPKLKMAGGGLVPLGFFTKRGLVVLGQIARHKLVVKGLIKHPLTSLRFIALVSIVA